MKKIFYLIPFFNSESTILNCLTSIFSDKYNLEVILINDNSLDDSLKIVESIKNQLPFSIHIINNKTNLGISSSLNLGIDLALKKNADYLIRLDSDDYDQQNRVDSQIDFMEENKNIMIYTSNAFILKNNNIVISRLLGIQSYFENLFRPFSNLVGSIDLHPTFCMRIDPFRDFGLKYGTIPNDKKLDFNFPFMKNGMEDLLLINILLYYYGYNSVFRDPRKKLITYRLNTNSLTPNSKRDLNKLLDHVLLANNILYLKKFKNNNLFLLCKAISKHQLKSNLLNNYFYALIGYLIVKLRDSNLLYKILFSPIFIFTIPRITIQYMRK